MHVRRLNPYQALAGADGGGSSHAGGLHRAEEVAGSTSPGAAMLRPAGGAVPPLQDVVAREQPLVGGQVEHQRAAPVVDLVEDTSLRAEGSEVTPGSPKVVSQGVGDELPISGGFHRVDGGHVRLGQPTCRVRHNGRGQQKVFFFTFTCTRIFTCTLNFCPFHSIHALEGPHHSLTLTLSCKEGEESEGVGELSAAGGGQREEDDVQQKDNRALARTSHIARDRNSDRCRKSPGHRGSRRRWRRRPLRPCAAPCHDIT